VDEPLAVALKFGFLAVLYLFLLWVARSALRDLARGDDVQAGEPAPVPRRRQRTVQVGDHREAAHPRLEVVAAMGHEPGTQLQVDGGATLGRADGVDVRVDDPFASSAHARLFSRGEFMYLEDMGSTNGTFLNGRQVRNAERLRAADVIRIGDTEYRYRE
jgi:hypothetical protein